MHWGVDLSWGISFCLLWRGTVFHKKPCGKCWFTYDRLLSSSPCATPHHLSLPPGCHAFFPSDLCIWDSHSLNEGPSFLSPNTLSCQHPLSARSYCSDFLGQPQVFFLVTFQCPPITALSIPQNNGYVAAIPQALQSRTRSCSRPAGPLAPSLVFSTECSYLFVLPKWFIINFIFNLYNPVFPELTIFSFSEENQPFSFFRLMLISNINMENKWAHWHYSFS